MRQHWRRSRHHCNVTSTAFENTKNLDAFKFTDNVNIIGNALDNELISGTKNISLGACNITVEGYDADTKSAILNTSIEIDGDQIKFESAKVKLCDSTLANFVTESGAINLKNRRENYVIVSYANSTITAGKGNNTICASEKACIDASAGNDKIFGKSKEKEGSTTFFFLAGDERDIISDLEFLTEDNNSTANKIDITSDNTVTRTC